MRRFTALPAGNLLPAHKRPDAFSGLNGAHHWMIRGRMQVQVHVHDITVLDGSAQRVSAAQPYSSPTL